MALYNTKMKIEAERNRLRPCYVCKAFISNRHFLKHLDTCLTKYEDHLGDIGLIKCPLNQYHIVPKKYISDHLIRRCEDVRNRVKQQYYNHQLIPDTDEFEFRQEYDPDNLLTQQARDYLLIFKVDIKGNNIERSMERDADRNEHDESACKRVKSLQDSLD